MPDLNFRVRHIEAPNVDLDPKDFFTIVPTDEGDFIVPHNSEEIHSLQWGRIDGEEGLNLFVYIDKKPFGQTILYNKIDQHW